MKGPNERSVVPTISHIKVINGQSHQTDTALVNQILIYQTLPCSQPINHYTVTIVITRLTLSYAGGGAERPPPT